MRGAFMRVCNSHNLCCAILCGVCNLWTFLRSEFTLTDRFFRPIRITRNVSYMLQKNCPCLGLIASLFSWFKHESTIGKRRVSKTCHKFAFLSILFLISKENGSPVLPDKMWKLTQISHRFYFDSLSTKNI